MAIRMEEGAASLDGRDRWQTTVRTAMDDPQPLPLSTSFLRLPCRPTPYSDTDPRRCRSDHTS